MPTVVQNSYQKGNFVRIKHVNSPLCLGIFKTVNEEN